MNHPMPVTGQVLSRDPAAGTVHIWLLGLVDEAEEFTIPKPPGLPDWAVTNYVFSARLDSDVRTIAELAARPSALHSFEPGNMSLWVPGAFPPTHGNNVVAVTGTGKERRLFTARYQGGEWIYFCPTPIIIDPPLWWADMPESQ